MDSGINEGPVVDDASESAVEGVHELTVDAPPAGHEPAHGDVTVAAPTVAPAAIPDPTIPVVKRTPVKKRAGRLGKRPVFRIFQVTHRWFSLALGVVLLAIVLSGVALLYKDDVHKVLHPHLYQATPSSQPVSFSRSIKIAEKAEPGFKATWNQLAEGVYRVQDDAQKTVWVDAGTGHVNGTSNPSKGVFGILDNLHECALTCEGYSWYVPALNKPVHWWIFGEELTWGGLALGSVGLLLGFMVISGLFVWWPGIRTMSRGFKLRRKTNRYKFNYDLHKVAGAVVLPFLAVWALTGAGFELPVVKNVYYALLPGSAIDDPPEFASKPAKGVPVKDQPVIGLNEAIAAAEQKTGGVATGVTPIDPADKASYYDVWLTKAGNSDPYDESPYIGNVEARVDKYSGAVSPGYGSPGDTDTVAENLWEHWSFGLHAGTPINGWWRIFWLVFGLSPLLLAVTGVTTWWIRSRKAKRKKRMKKERAATKAALGSIG